jgi:hypothetical protein
LLSQGHTQIKKIKIKIRKNTHQGNKRKFLNKKDSRKKRKRIKVQTKQKTTPKNAKHTMGSLKRKNQIT